MQLSMDSLRQWEVVKIQMFYIYLETDKTYTSVYNDYKENYLNEFDGDVISYTN